MWSSLDGSQKRARTRTAAIVDHGTASRPSGSRRFSTSSRCSARQSVQPSQTSPKRRPRSSRIRLSRTGMASSATPGSKRSDCSRSPVIARASALARARPSGSSSPRWATVCWMTLRPTRTERTRRQYRWTLPSFRSVVWRRYITQLIGHVAPRSQRPWLALHHGCSSRRSMATTDTHGATWRSRRALAQTAEVGLAIVLVVVLAVVLDPLVEAVIRHPGPGAASLHPDPRGVQDHRRRGRSIHDGGRRRDVHGFPDDLRPAVEDRLTPDELVEDSGCLIPRRGSGS